MGLREAAAMVVGDYDLHGTAGRDVLKDLKSALSREFVQTGSLTTIPYHGGDLNLDIRDNTCLAKIGGVEILNVQPAVAVHLALQILSVYANPAAQAG